MSFLRSTRHVRHDAVVGLLGKLRRVIVRSVLQHVSKSVPNKTWATPASLTPDVLVDRADAVEAHTRLSV